MIEVIDFFLIDECLSVQFKILFYQQCLDITSLKFILLSAVIRNKIRFWEINRMLIKSTGKTPFQPQFWRMVKHQLKVTESSRNAGFFSFSLFSEKESPRGKYSQMILTHFSKPVMDDLYLAE